MIPPKPSTYVRRERRKKRREGGRKRRREEGREGGGKDIYLIWWGGAWISRNPSWPSVTLELGSQVVGLRVLTQVLEGSISYRECG